MKKHGPVSIAMYEIVYGITRGYVFQKNWMDCSRKAPIFVLFWGLDRDWQILPRGILPLISGGRFFFEGLDVAQPKFPMFQDYNML